MLVRPQTVHLLRSSRIFWLLLLFLLCIALPVVYLNRCGMVLSDPYWYARFSHELSCGEWPFYETVFSHRYAMLLPQSLFFKIWDVNVFSVAAWPFLCYLALGLLTARALRGMGTGLAIFTTAVLWLNPVSTAFASQCYPDLPLLLWMTLSLLLMYRHQDARRPWLRGLLYSLVMFLAFMTKEQVLYILPFTGVVMADALWRRKFHRGFWITALVTGVLCMGTYFLTYALLTGDPFWRFSIIEKEHNIMYHYTRASLIQRMSWEYFAALFGISGYGQLAVPALFALLIPLRKSRADLPAATLQLLRYASLFFVSYSLVYWFSTTSLKALHPFPFERRLMMGFFLPLAILAWLGIREIFSGNWPRKTVFLLLGAETAVTLMSLSLYNKQAIFTLLIILLVTGLCLLKKPGPWLRIQIAGGMIAGSIGLHSLYLGIWGAPLNGQYFTENAWLHAFAQGDEPVTLITDPDLAAGADLYFGFRPIPSRLQILDWSVHPDSVRGEGRKLYFLMNQMRFKGLSQNLATPTSPVSLQRTPIPAWADSLPARQQPVRRDDVRQVYLYPL